MAESSPTSGGSSAFPRELPASNLLKDKRGLGEEREGLGLKEVELGNFGVVTKERDVGRRIARGL